MRPDQMPWQPFPADQDLAWLPEDVQRDVRTMDAGNTVNGAWNACRDELVRLARENAEYHEKLGDALGRETRERLRAERAEAELAALDLKVHGAPFIEASKARGVGARIECEGLPADWIGQRVALLPVGGEG